MDRERLARLTDKQRACLRLVYAHLSSKEIAPRLNVEPGTVDQYIKAAMRTLGVGDRRAAARMLAEYEADAAQPLVYQPSDIAAGVDPEKLDASTGDRREAAIGGAVHEDMAHPGSFSAPPPPASLPFPLPVGGRRPSELGPAWRLAWIFALILLIALAFGLFVAGFEALSRLGR
ncbi:MAG: helix-turn-helix transcriptional regulator [Sphingomonas sp.]|nr:helix-turn-helix transcriptional regulator [Sphingomonas sp.]